MSSETVLRNCSPTLAGMKTGSLFSCGFGSKQELRDTVRLWNRMMVKKGLRMVPLRFVNGRALIYVFRVSQLKADLCNSAVAKMLADRGYCPKDPGSCIHRLQERLQDSDEFPHEIGLFLGYPPEDVCGFMENRSDFVCVGTWKVYRNAEQAQKTFAKFRKCTSVYCEQHSKGRTIDRLIVAG